MPRSFHPIALAPGLLAGAMLADAAEPVPTYNKDIRPIFSDKCIQCHGPDSAGRKGDLRLDRREDALAAKAFVPGNPAASHLIQRIHEKDPKEVMPPPESPRQLNDHERDLLARWIAGGAVYEKHWSFSPLPASIAVPTPKDAAWPKEDLDRFIAARLDQESLTPSTPASPERWLRRVTFDLTGLPVTRAELDAFLADKENGARERAVERLLASPHYGEKMAVDWLDVARYADSYGYQSDLDTNAWPYRDWVIDALNRNLSWDQFITWQLAGDLLPSPTREQRIATTFNRVHRKTQEGGSVEEEFRQEGVSDRVHTVGTAFLGLTMECTRCHDHKYDPLTQHDYYSLGAFFNSIDEWGLLHGNGSIQPNPSLLLTTVTQDNAIAAQTAAITQAEAALAKQRAEKEAAFQAWLAAPSGPTVDLMVSCDLDALDRNNLDNTADPKKPATTDPKNKLVPGHRGQALSFTGDDPLNLGNPGITNREDPVSMAFWLKPGPVSKRQVVFHNCAGYDPGYNGFELLLEDGRLRWQVSREWPGNCISVRSQPIVPSGQWTHVVVTYDGSSRAAGLKVFLNGQAAPLDTVRDHLSKNSGSGSGFAFGERVRDSGLRDGAVDDIRLYKRAITPFEVEALAEDKSLSDQIAGQPKDDAGLAKLRDFYFSAIDPDLRKATADLEGLRSALRKTLDGVKELPVMEEMKEARPAYILSRGTYDAPQGDALPRETPAALPPMSADLPRNRLGLARWLTQPDHPLTARVQVNRVWQHFFGRGLVATSENFGAQGELPSHPELLDWLARDFIAHGWDMKRLCRQIVLSATYSQDSKTSRPLRERDPSNVLLARGPAKRLPAEELRDQALALSGLMQATIGGPSVKPYLPDAATWRALNNFLPEYKRDAAPAIYRRSLYTFWRRTAPPPGMLAFDSPGREVCVVKRQQTNTPLQPLVMLNDPQFVEASRALAIRMMKEGGGDPAARAAWVFRETLDRQPDARESKLLDELYASQLETFQADPKQAEAYLKVGDLKAPADLPAPELAASAALANAVLNLDEAITLR
ncbi:DUF1553 domain-containing protein [Luteolibacter ambystomatis]|uniref:DUF1553 domain-containing protein n=1 Tax=Luteolibacter ambystomatis TaxID=2824561 RepID=A0A975IZ50_9BACT|nr:DUF1553 domain-containing protein [Luteolibacter ambystomatis]QUE50927.1 DUF1553 domain-containing protein [Luteolibacter ambystomatis]